VRGDPLVGPLQSAGPRRAHFLRCGAPRPALGRLGKARGEGGSWAPAACFTAQASIFFKESFLTIGSL